jgi:hypothetical protein
MSLSDLASLGSFVSGIAVLVSLVFLYFQLRQIGVQIVQAERNQKAAIRQARVARIIESSSTMTDAHVAEAVYKGMRGDEDISLVQLQQFLSHVIGRLYNAEDAFYQYQEGLLDQAAFEGFERTMRGTFSWPGMRVAYRDARGNFATDFASFMDRILAEVPIPDRGDRLAKWNADMAAEKSSGRG